MRCTLSLSILTSLFAGLVLSTPISITKRELPEGQNDAEAVPVPESSPSPTIVKIADPTFPPNAKFIEPPPLFDPPEPRPNPLFDTPNEQPLAEHLSHAPPLPADRKEVLLPFDGAHVHPEITPYLPEEGPPGTCTYSERCSYARTCVEITATLVGILMIAWMCIWTIEKMVRSIVRTATARTRSPSGSLRMEPELKKKEEAPNPPLQAWSSEKQEQTKEKKVSFAV